MTYLSNLTVISSSFHYLLHPNCSTWYYSETSLVNSWGTPKQCSLYRVVHPRGVRYVHAHMWLKYNVHIIKTVSYARFLFRMLLTAPIEMPHWLAKFLWLWLLTLWLVLIFPASSSSLVLLTCLQRQTRCAHYDCNLQTDWNLAISLKHCRHDW